MVVVEDVVVRSDFFGNDDEWEEEEIFGTSNLKEMNNVDVNVGTEDDWEDEGIFYLSTEHNDEDEDAWNDDLKS
eukprot:15066678-Ditylum_brightwellii.AAC.1